MAENRDGRIVETATEARAGRPGVPVLYVLLISIAATVVFFGVIYLVFFTH